jgi:ribonucleoside-diphosphate reductase alpha chain/ribonucleoside-triphosphate reductase
MTEQEVDVETQFASYFRFQRAYTDHNSSNTIVVEPHEWKKTSDIVHENWDDFVGVSFLAKSGGTYQLAPYEQNPTAYEELKKTMIPFDMDVLAQHEIDEDSELYDSDCKDGNCAIR